MFGVWAVGFGVENSVFGSVCFRVSVFCFQVSVMRYGFEGVGLSDRGAGSVRREPLRCARTCGFRVSALGFLVSFFFFLVRDSDTR